MIESMRAPSVGEAVLAELTGGFGGRYFTYLDTLGMRLSVVWRVDWRVYRANISYQDLLTRPHLAVAIVDRVLPWLRDAEAIRKRRTMDFGGGL